MNEEIRSTSASSKVREAWKRITLAIPRDDWLVVGWAMATKALLVLFGVASYQAIEDEKVSFGWPWLEIWNQWDAIHFLRIAEFGYSARGALAALAVALGIASLLYAFVAWPLQTAGWLAGAALLRVAGRHPLAVLFAR